MKKYIKKNTLATLTLCFISMKLLGQLEVKIQPLIFLPPIKSLNIALEYGIKPRLGLEIEYQRIEGKNLLNPQFGLQAQAFYVSVKRYMQPNSTLSKFYIGGYSHYIETVASTSINSTAFAFGIPSGYKALLLKNHFILETCLNMGKRFSYKNGKPVTDKDFSSGELKFFYYWDISLRILVGYRF